MKILQIAHCFPPESMTGAEICAYNLAKRLSDKHEVSVFYRINDPLKKDYEVIKNGFEGIRVYKINNTLRHYNSIEKVYHNKRIEEAFAEVLKEAKPDIAHIHHLLFLSLGIIAILRKSNIPIVFTLHDYWLICPRGQLLRPDCSLCKEPFKANCLFCLAMGMNPKNLAKRLLKLPIGKKFSRDLKDICGKVDLFIAPSNHLRNRFIKFGVPPEKIVYSDNGMDISLFKDTEKTASDKIRFGFIGTLIPSKGAHVLIKAFNKIREGKAVLKIYGKSPVNNGIFDYYHRINRMARNNKNIKFMGTYDNKDVAKIFKKIDILIFPSLWQENAPLVLREAILTKTPVIASDIGGAPDIIRHGKNGFLFKAGDEEQLSKFMQDIIKNPSYIDDFKKYHVNIKNIDDNARELENIYYENIKN